MYYQGIRRFSEVAPSHILPERLYLYVKLWHLGKKEQPTMRTAHMRTKLTGYTNSEPKYGQITISQHK